MTSVTDRSSAHAGESFVPRPLSAAMQCSSKNLLMPLTTVREMSRGSSEEPSGLSTEPHTTCGKISAAAEVVEAPTTNSSVFCNSGCHSAATRQNNNKDYELASSRKRYLFHHHPYPSAVFLQTRSTSREATLRNALYRQPKQLLLAASPWKRVEAKPDLSPRQQVSGARTMPATLSCLRKVAPRRSLQHQRP